MRECVNQANQAQDKFLKLVEVYNVHREILQEAKDACGYDYKIPEEIKIPDCFSIIEVEVNNIPKVDIHKENKQ